MCTCEVSNDLAFLVGSNLFPQKLIDALPLEKHFDNVRDGNLKSFGKLVDETKVTYSKDEKIPGREILLSNDAGQLYRARIFIVKTRLYQVIVVGKSDVVKSEAATKYLDSFEIAE